MKVYAISFYYYENYILTVFAEAYPPLDLLSRKEVSSNNLYHLYVSDTSSMENKYEMLFDKSKFSHIKTYEVIPDK